MASIQEAPKIATDLFSCTLNCRRLRPPPRASPGLDNLRLCCCNACLLLQTAFTGPDILVVFAIRGFPLSHSIKKYFGKSCSSYDQAFSAVTAIPPQSQPRLLLHHILTTIQWPQSQSLNRLHVGRNFKLRMWSPSPTLLLLQTSHRMRSRTRTTIPPDLSFPPLPLTNPIPQTFSYLLAFLLPIMLPLPT